MFRLIGRRAKRWVAHILAGLASPLALACNAGLSDLPGEGVAYVELSPAVPGASPAFTVNTFGAPIPLDVIERVAERWSAATGIPIETAPAGLDPVGWSADSLDVRSGAEIRAGAEPEGAQGCSLMRKRDNRVERQGIMIDPSITDPEDVERILMHEVGHLLMAYAASAAPDGGHLESGVMAGHWLTGEHVPLDTASVVKICETAPCLWVQGES